jgi:hypothetical protein
MAELADAADLKSAGLKKLVGVRVPLSAPENPDAKGLIHSSQVGFLLGGCVSVTNNVTYPLFVGFLVLL